MSNIQIKDANGDIKYLKTTGAGTDGDPYISVQDVYLQDHTHLIKNLPFRNNDSITTLSVDAVVDSRVITLTDATGFDAGDFLSIMCTASDTCYFGVITDVTGSDITLDTPMDLAYSAASATVTSGTTDMSVNGASSTVTYSIRANDPGIQTTFHVTKLSLSIESTTTPIYTDFGDITGGITNGFVIRKVDGTNQNLFNVKSNADLALYGSEFAILNADPTGINGIAAKNIFGGQENFGAVISLAPGEDLEIIIQDDLSSLTSFKLIAQGHVAE